MNFVSQTVIASPLVPRLVDTASEAPAMGVSPFARAADDLIAAGYTPIPIMPVGLDADKAPGTYRGAIGSGRWSPAEGWNSYAHSKPSEASIERWKTWPNANVGIVLGTPVGGHVVIALDFDTTDERELDLLRSQVPPSPMMKQGARGFTAFYRTDNSVKTKRYMIPAPTADKPNAKRTVLEILTGNAPRQTVMPPSAHPAGRDYEWMTGDGIVPARDLPVLSDHHFEQLEDTLEHMGWQGDIAQPARSVADDGGGDVAASVNRQLNDVALANLDRWARDLQLPKLHRHPNGAWEAVPVWRASNEGRPTMQRKPNLKLHPSGVRDMGTDDRFTAIDTVMKAFNLSSSEAFAWLASRINAFPEHDDLPSAEVLFASAERRRLSAIEATVARQGDVLTWDNRRANAARSVDWLVKHLFPQVGVSLLWGQSGSGKSFVALDLAASVATGSDFFGHRVKTAGGTLFALGEGEGAMPGRLNAIRLGKLGDMPSDPTTGQVVNADELPIAWMPVGNLSNAKEFEVFAAHVRRASAEMLEKHDCPLRLVVIDTVVASFGFPEDPDASSVTRAMKSLDELAQELGLLVVAIHHAGKSKAAAEHGSYAWRGSAETSIEVDADRNEATGRVADRRLVVRKNRHGGNEGWANSFELSTVVLGTDEDGDDVTSCVVLPSRVGESASASRQGLSQVAERFLTAFHTVRDAGGGSSLTLATGCAVLAVRSRDAKAQFEAQATTGNADSKRRQADRGRKAAIEAGLLAEESAGETWLYLPTEGVLANDNLPGQRPGQRPF